MRRRVLALTAALVLTPASAALAAGSAAAPSAPVQSWLAGALAHADAAAPLRVFVHADTAPHARQAAHAAGLAVVETFNQVGIAVATGRPDAVRAVAAEPHVVYVEGDRPVTRLGTTSTVATRSAEAVGTLTGANGTRLDGTGVSIAIIDSGIDGTHPYFRGADGKSKVVKNVKSLCLFVQLANNNSCFADVPTNDSDTPSLGGHGTHVAGIAAGVPTKVGAATIQGSAPGAKLVGVSVGQAVSVYGGDSGLNWVLDHHNAPCGAGVSAAACPPIKVTNNSYGVQGGSAFDPNSATVKLQRALVGQGVVTAWAAGNDGGDGSGSSETTNGPGMDPTGGIIMVASYDDHGNGSRDGVVSDFSSRGVRGQLATYPDISAPGTDIESSCRAYLTVCSTGLAPMSAGDYNTISGTSMATPQIAGIVAQLFQAKPTATPAEVEAAITGSAHRFTDGAGYESGTGGTLTSFDKGRGLVDTVAAVARLGG